MKGRRARCGSTSPIGRGVSFALCLCILVVTILSCATPSPGPGARRVEVNVRPGMEIAEVTDTLLAKGVIDNRLKFRFYSWYYNYAPRIKPGRYRFAAGSSERRVLRLLAREEPALVMVTVPEGYTMKQVAGVLEQAGVCAADSFLSACSDAALLRDFAIPAASAEGYLFPETYEFLTGSSPAEVVRRLVRQFHAVMNELRPQATAKMTDHAYVTLASIVEREALPAEFRRVAGVFANRLRRRIPLQSCATVEYILPERKAQLSVEDTRYPSPYNTYINMGLPPGPIASPGRRALEAALNPERHTYLFFVARGDGSHIFSRTPAEHAAACRLVSSGG
jgi:UPF0755 protein